MRDATTQHMRTDELQGGGLEQKLSLFDLVA